MGPAGPGAGLVPASGIRHATIEGLEVFLDLERGTYKVFDDIASRMWPAVLAPERASSVIDELAREFEISRENLEGEIGAFSRQCVQDGLLANPAQPDADGIAGTAPRTWRGPRGLRAWLCLQDTRRRLAAHGFPRTYRAYARLVTPVHGVPASAPLASFVRAENWFLSRRAPDDCLVRSLALYRFLCGEGHPVEHIIGARRTPFRAHAWVEYAGTPLLGDRAHGFTPLARMGGMAAQRALRG